MVTCAVCGYAAGGEFRFCPECGARAGPVVREQRKVVTLVFCDVVGYTALGEELDPEAPGELQGRYFERMRSAVERHEGTVDKFIGDAVMAVVAGSERWILEAALNVDHEKRTLSDHAADLP